MYHGSGARKQEPVQPTRASAASPLPHGHFEEELARMLFEVPSQEPVFVGGDPVAGHWRGAI